MTDLQGVADVLAFVDKTIDNFDEENLFGRSWRNDEVREVLTEIREGLADDEPSWAEVSVSELIGERDRARRWAVRLEQELVESEEWKAAYRLRVLELEATLTKLVSS